MRRALAVAVIAAAYSSLARGLELVAFTLDDCGAQEVVLRVG
jgi:hypothetical protein